MNNLDTILQKYIMRRPEINIILFKVLGLGGIFVSLISALYSLLLRGFLNATIDLVVALIAIGLLVFVEKTGRYVIGYLTVVISVFMGFFTVLYLKNGGMNGAMPFFFTFAIIYTFLMFEDKLLIGVVAIEVAYYLGLVIVTYKFPILITQFSSDSSQILNQLIGVLFSALVMGVMIHFYVNEYKKQKRIAEEANIAKSMFLANMSHEIRTPINAILGFNEMILRESDDVTTQEYADKINVAGKQLQEVVNQVLDFSRLESGKEQVVNEEYRLQELVDELKIYSESAARKKKLDFQIVVDSDLAFYYIGDKEKITRILVNLLSNAIKYTFEGSVRLNVKSVLKTEDFQTIHFEIMDTGVGIEKDDLDSLFHNYERVDLLKNQKIQGTGLGLAIAQHLAELMDSKINVESEYGKGSTFYFDIRQIISDRVEATDDNQDTTKQESLAASKGSSENASSYIAPDAHILVVDDNEMNRVVIKMLLKKSMIKVDVVESAKECFEKMKQSAYDIILMDYMMPEMDGLEAMKQIRKEEEAEERYTPIFVLTADVAEKADERLIAEGFDEYIAKPVKVDELMEKLLDYIPEEKVLRSSEDELSLLTEETLEKYVQELLPYDVELRSGLRYASNDIVQYFRVVGFFLENVIRCRDGLEDLFARMDVDELRLFTHSLKGNSKAVGAIELFRICRTLEERCKKNDVEYIQQNEGLLQFELNRTYEGLLEFTNRYSQQYIKEKKIVDEEAERMENNSNDNQDYEVLLRALKENLELYQKRLSLKSIVELKSLVEQPVKVEIGAQREARLEIISQLEGCLANADFESALELVEKLE